MDDGIEHFHRLLGELRALPPDDPARLRAESAAAAFARDGRKRRRGADRRADTAARDAFTPPAAPTSYLERGTLYRRARRCALCAAKYHQAHHPYHHLCPACAHAHWQRRHTHAALDGRTALVTHAHDGPGFALAWRLLRDGATVITAAPEPERTLRRFGHAFAHRERWEAMRRGEGALDRLHVVEADLSGERDVRALAAETARLSGGRLSVLVHTATPPLDPQGPWDRRLTEATLNTVVPGWLTERLRPALVASPGGAHVITAAPAVLQAPVWVGVTFHAVDPGVPDHRSPVPPLDAEDAAATLYAPLVAAFPRAT
ncbi:hypothetical protein Afil01_01180 [Actinorhabdospora filicis]|uniref:Short-chain dehydrogenase n=1 Tax=Actinorhabdospora filicis TaxID=1785913 RepID=A0A9W6SIK2_9ACTN|nr:hypothetical protein [Actinorhabdospora filicis]GLZ75311.1 hypothetical protein Afil01_01180 [Actinorhabdospora filicis]